MDGMIVLLCALVLNAVLIAILGWTMIERLRQLDRHRKSIDDCILQLTALKSPWASQAAAAAKQASTAEAVAQVIGENARIVGVDPDEDRYG